LKVFTALYGLSDAADRARELRDAGASGVASFEGAHDVFAPLTLAATVGGLDLMTNVAIAFPRNPIHLAHQANDHQLLSSGRFILGLGTQIRTQIEKRFGAQFDKPVARMTELIAALRAIFAAWNSGERLDFRGNYYRHTLMTPTFNPGPNPYGPPPIYVGALGPLLTRAVAEHADGLLVMPFSSKRFLHEHTMPSVREGLHAAGRQPGDLAVLPEIIVSAGARLGGPATRAQRAVQAGPLARHGRIDRRRDAAHHRGLRHPRGRRETHSRPRRRRRRHRLPLPAGTDEPRHAGRDHRRTRLIAIAWESDGPTLDR
jgi:probable F420-dependent oxidoreductase